MRRMGRMISNLRHGGMVMIRVMIAVLFVAASVVVGFAVQEESGACLPERHAADQENARFCHCIDMGGTRYCKEDENGIKRWNYQNWAADDRPTPMCEMACREKNCKCCAWQDDYEKRQKRAAITIPYDKY